MGHATIAGLPTGAYTVTEDEDGAKINYYTLNVTGNNASVTVTKNGESAAAIDNAYSETFEGQEPAKLTVKKAVLDADTKQAIATTNTYSFKVEGTTVYGDPYEKTVSNVLVDDTGVTIELPYGTYEVTELTPVADIEGYTYVNVEFDKNTTFTVTNLDTENGSDQYTITAINTYDRDHADLTIEKQVEGGPASAADSKVYTFDIRTTLADADGTYSATWTDQAGTKTGTITFAGGVAADVSITGEGILTIVGLPTGSYQIVEDDANDIPYWTWTNPGTISASVAKTGTNKATITNIYSRVPVVEVTAELTITKNIEGRLNGVKDDLTASADTTYYFQITGTDVYGAAVSRIVPVTVNGGTATGSTADAIKLTYGDYTVTEVNADGSPITEDSVADFTGYTWSKTASTIATTAAIELDESNKTGSFTATNVYDRDLTGLTVTKIFKDLSAADIGRLESFKLTVAGPDDFNGGKAQELKLAQGTEGYAQGKGITYTWTLENIPTGAYTVTENRKDVKLAEYNLTVKGSVNTGALDVIQASDDSFSQTVDLIANPNSTVTFQNAYTRQLGKLELAKAVVGDAEDSGKLPEGAADAKTYTFTLTGPADVMNYGENGAYKNGTVVFALDEGGQTASATVTITGAGSKTIPGLPTGTYTVTEDKAGADVEYWDLTVTGEGSVDVTNNGTAEVTVTNTYAREVPPVDPPEEELVTLTITKVVKDSRGGDLSALADGKNYYFQITGKDVYGDDPLTETVTVTGAGSVDVDLIYGTYTVTEVTDNMAEIDGYQWTKVEYTGNTGIDLNKENTEATVIATNTYEPVAMDIPVVKTWSGDYNSLPGSIEVALYADGADTGLRLTLDSGDQMDDTHWLGIFESTAEQPLYRYADGGHEIVYSVVETRLGGSTVTGNTVGDWTITTGQTTAGEAGVAGFAADALVLSVENNYDWSGEDGYEPTPSPSTEPTPTPVPSDEVEIPDDDTPMGDLPEEVPEDIPDGDIPMGGLPEDPGETDIVEEGVPMGNLPQTGTQGVYSAVDPTRTLGMMALTASLMAAGLLVLIGRRKDEETEQDD